MHQRNDLEVSNLALLLSWPSLSILWTAPHHLSSMDVPAS